MGIEAFCAAMTLAGLVYLLMALRAGRRFALDWRVPVAAAAAPTVTLLKPLKGAEPTLYEALRSHCVQQYAGRYEILFGVASADDAAVAVVERLRVEFPALAMRLIVCAERLGTNGKASTLAQMLPHALGDVVLVNDADIAVRPEYLSAIAAAFGRGAKVGMVTAPYRGVCVAPVTLPARMEALGISTEFFPSVLVARMMERGIRFGLGSTLAVRREALEAAGGFAALVEYLGDDYELGVRVHRAGYSVELCAEVVETAVPRYGWRGFCDHQLRWMRSVRDSRRWGYAGVCVTYATAWALATCVASGGALWSFSLLSIAVLARVAVALMIGVGILRDGQVLRDVLLVPVRDCVGLLLWAWSFASDEVVWRGERFHLKDGKLSRI